MPTVKKLESRVTNLEFRLLFKNYWVSSGSRVPVPLPLPHTVLHLALGLILDPTLAKLPPSPCPPPVLCLSLPGKFLITLQGPTPASPVTVPTFPWHNPSTTVGITPSWHCLRVCLRGCILRLSRGRDLVTIAFVSPRPSRKPDLNNVEFSKCLLNVWKEIRAKTL